MPEHPAEIPSEGEGGSGGGFRWRPHGGIGGPAEIPIPDGIRVSAVQLVNEIFRLRGRVNALENTMLAAKMRGGASAMFGGGIGGPNELPEGEGGGGGGGGGEFPGEIQEISPAELPISRVFAELASLAARFTHFERQVSQQFASITQRLDAMKK